MVGGIGIVYYFYYNSSGVVEVIAVAVVHEK